MINPANCYGQNSEKVNVPLLPLSTALYSSVITVTVSPKASGVVMYAMNNHTTHEPLGAGAVGWLCLATRSP